MSDDPDRWHTARETAELLGIGRARLRVSGLPHMRVGRRCFYLRSDIEAYRPVATTNRRAEFCRQRFTVYRRWTDEDGRSRALSDHQLYETWRAMMNRCYVGHDWRNWDAYGGRGIRVDEPWHDPETFIQEVENRLGPRPPGRTLHRSDNDGNYEPGNVVWATPSEQNAGRGSVLDAPQCLCRFDCSYLPGVCPEEDLPWAAATSLLAALRQRIEMLRDAPLPSIVQHLHTGHHDDCLACVKQDPLRTAELLDGVTSPYERCAEAAGYSHRHLAPLGLFGV